MYRTSSSEIIPLINVSRMRGSSSLAFVRETCVSGTHVSSYPSVSKMRGSSSLTFVKETCVIGSSRQTCVSGTEYVPSYPNVSRMRGSSLLTFVRQTCVSETDFLLSTNERPQNLYGEACVCGRLTHSFCLTNL